ncbi:hypothetical protein SAMN02746098_02796 [Desulfosporosinus lacus DSM 15449]|uniref:Uncharacterized protein n=1 Tax=Desulfosporosinus lacus DSM 15449 TaxID=1121420 RepID=A0A1M5YZJ5_9FIRM|nr:hypothetical protein SAMN02746098_02796 [Desulfosporosinus lacus DSM 15449]
MPWAALSNSGQSLVKNSIIFVFYYPKNDSTIIGKYPREEKKAFEEGIFRAEHYFSTYSGNLKHDFKTLLNAFLGV